MSQDWTTFNIANDTSQQRDSSDNVALWMESLMRVTCAGFCGALVGMSRQNQSSASKIFQRAVVSGGKKRPPRAVPRLKTVQIRDETNIPLQWAFSFMAFVSILETSRFWSPTTLIINLQQQKYAEGEGIGDAAEIQPERGFQQHLPGGQKSLATILDYTLGGTVAGLAGGMAKQRPPPSSSSTSPLQLPSSVLKSGRRSLIMTGVGTGLALGLIAGIFQAGLDVMESYAREEEARQQEQEEQNLRGMQQLERMGDPDFEKPHDDKDQRRVG